MENQLDASHIAGHFFSAGAIGTAWASVFGYAPIIVATAASTVAFIWYMIQIWESRPFQHWVRNWRQKRMARKYAQLKAREKVIAAKLEAIEVIRKARVEAREKVSAAAYEAEQLRVKQEAELQSKLPPI